MRSGNILRLLIISLLIFIPNEACDKSREVRREVEKIERSLITIEGSGTSPEMSPYGPGDYQRTIVFEKRKRRYEVHVPPTYKKTSAMPAILVFHGGGGRAPSTRVQTNLDQKADRVGCILVYPEGTSRWGGPFLTYNAGSCCGYAQKNKVNDVGFVAALLKDLSKFFNIHPKRIYATGFSNGAMLAYRLACELSDKIAAIAPVAGTLGVKSCNPSRPISVIHIHGTEDQNSPYRGGTGKFSLSGTRHESVRRTIDYWIKQNRCREKPVELVNKKNATIETYRAKDGTEVVLVTIDRMGHGWPGGRSVLPKSVEGEIDSSIKADELIWQFFQKHPLN